MSQVAERQENSAQNELILRYYPLARAIACRIHQRLPQGVDLDDLMSSAVQGLIEAVERFDPEREVAFRTFAKHRIQGSVMDSLRSSDWVPRSVRRKAEALERARTQLGSALGRAPSRDEIANFLEIAPAQLDEMIHGSEIRQVLSLDVCVTEDNPAPLAEAIADESSDLHADVQVEQLRVALAEAVNSLPERERTAIVLYYFQELSLKEVGAVLDVTESRACQICTQAIKRLRLRMAGHVRN